MYSIAFETTDRLSIGLFKNKKLLSFKELMDTQSISNDFFSLLLSILEEQNLDIQDINLIILNQGPGRFTLTRIGITIGRAFIQFGSCKFILLSSFDILRLKAKKFLKRKDRIRNVKIIPIIYAFNQKVFVFLNKKLGYIRFGFDELIEKLAKVKQNVFLIGSGIWIYQKEFLGASILKNKIFFKKNLNFNYIQAKDLGIFGIKKFLYSKSNLLDYKKILPLY